MTVDPALDAALAAWRMQDERRVKLPELSEENIAAEVETFLASDDTIGVLGRLDSDFAKTFRK